MNYNKLGRWPKLREAVRMNIRWNWLLVLMALSAAVAAGGSAFPTLDARVMEVSVARHQGVLWRYARFSTESDYPCLRFEAINPEQGWRVTERRDICDVGLRDNVTLDFRDTAYTGFPLVVFSRENSAFTFEVEFIRRTAPGEKNVSCTLPVTDKGSFGTLMCR